MDSIFKSKAVWTALLSFLGVIVAYYTQVPEEVWQSFALFALSVVAVFAIDEGAQTFGRTMGRTIYELREKNKK